LYSVHPCKRSVVCPLVAASLKGQFQSAIFR